MREAGMVFRQSEITPRCPEVDPRRRHQDHARCSQPINLRLAQCSHDLSYDALAHQLREGKGQISPYFSTSPPILLTRPCLEDRYVGVLKKFSSYIEGSVIEGQMDPAVVGTFKMTPLVSSMASDLKKAAEANDVVSVPFNPLLNRRLIFI